MPLLLWSLWLTNVPVFHVLFKIFIYFFITSTIWCGTRNRVGLQFKCVLTDNPPISGEVDHTTRVFIPYTFRLVVWVFLRPTRTDKWKCCGTWPTVFCPCLRRLESLIICRCHCKGSIFSSVIYRPWMLVWPGFEPTTSCSAHRHSPNSQLS